MAVKGREQRFMIYELLGMAGSDDPELRPKQEAAELIRLTCEASALFESEKFEEAGVAYGKILSCFPGDPVARAMLAEPELRG
jgi:adenylate cyclase